MSPPDGRNPSSMHAASPNGTSPLLARRADQLVCIWLRPRGTTHRRDAMTGQLDGCPTELRAALERLADRPASLRGLLDALDDFAIGLRADRAAALPRAGAPGVSAEPRVPKRRGVGRTRCGKGRNIGGSPSR